MGIGIVRLPLQKGPYKVNWNTSQLVLLPSPLDPSLLPETETYPVRKNISYCPSETMF